MVVGIPKGLLYPKYHVLFESFFTQLGADTVTSPDTNRMILDEGVKYCVDEACLPVKIFHGHVAYLRDKCDAVLIPRFMQVRGREYICPKFCGLTEMIKNSIPDLPLLLGEPIYLNNIDNFSRWALKTGSLFTKDKEAIFKAFGNSILLQNGSTTGFNDSSHNLKIALLGHPYCIYDEFLNMNIIKKLKKLDIGIITEEHVSDCHVNEEVNSLNKRPFWAFARDVYGSAMYLYKHRQIDGIIYLSSFACGIDSVLIDMIQLDIKDLPILVLKIDEHTGEAGFDTRVEAFSDMLQRRNRHDNNISAYGQCVPCGKSLL